MLSDQWITIACASSRAQCAVDRSADGFALRVGDERRPDLVHVVDVAADLVLVVAATGRHRRAGLIVHVGLVREPGSSPLTRTVTVVDPPSASLRTMTAPPRTSNPSIDAARQGLEPAMGDHDRRVVRAGRIDGARERCDAGGEQCR